MRKPYRKGLATVMLTGGALALAGPAHADAQADGAAVGSPGVAAGNALQLPVSVPVNVCGNTISVVGLLNPAFGNSCANDSQGAGHRDERPRGSSKTTTPSGQGAAAGAVAKGSPGLLSGNGVQLPVDLPVQVTGNTVSVVGLLNPAMGNTSVNGPGEPSGPKPPQPTKPTVPPTAPPPKPGPPPRPAPETPADRSAPDEDREALAATGAGPIGYAVPGAAALLLGGIALHRRGRRA